MTKNQIAFLELQETKRANQAREAETFRSNRAQEMLTGFRDRSSIQQRDREIAESVRANLAREAETSRSNVARESETYRSNYARETETQRHNIASERVDAIKASAAIAQSQAALRQAAASEQATQLRGMELSALENYRSATLYQEQQRIGESYRSNVAKEVEQRRHNAATEKVDKTKLSQEDRRIQQSDEKLGIEQRNADTQRYRLYADIKRNKDERLIGYWNAANGTLSALSRFNKLNPKPKTK